MRSWVEICGSDQRTCSRSVDLCMRSWVEIVWSVLNKAQVMVDLCMRSWVEIFCFSTASRTSSSRPLYEVVSWNSPTLQRNQRNRCRPLYEVVSWNIFTGDAGETSEQSTSVWGRELKCSSVSPENDVLKSTSVWGRELKCKNDRLPISLVSSTSVWGRELK